MDKQAKAVATAVYSDAWAGDVRAFLVPQRTKRNGQAVTVYRWLTERGSLCDGLRCGFGADRMVAHAKHHRLFSAVVGLAVSVS